MRVSAEDRPIGSAAPAVWQIAAFRSYLRATAFTGIAFSIQQLLVSWLLVGVLLLPGDQVGLAQAAIGVPGILLMLWGGASADRVDPRTILLRVYLLAPIVPLLLVAADAAEALNTGIVVSWGLCMGVAMSFANPAQAALLNRVSGEAVQQGVTASTAIAFVVQMIGLSIAGQLERLGLATVLVVQALSLSMGVLAIRRIPSRPVADAQPRGAGGRGVLEGLRETARDRVVASVVGLNFASSIFNAGSFVTVFPFIVKRVYEGNASLLATMMIVFFGGAAVSNLLMLRFMPLARPGRIYLLAQLSRLVIVYLIWIEPHWWLLVAATILWGLNMGITSTLARSIVQESASPEYRGRTLSIFNIAVIGSMPLGAIVLGWLIEAVGTLNALVPAMGVSVALFGVGVTMTPIWSYRSPQSKHRESALPTAR